MMPDPPSVPRVMVSGCFDLLHPGHIAFLQEAAELGDVYVSLGSDRTVLALKRRPPFYNEQERKYMLEALRCVKKVYIGPGSGKMDFAALIDEIRPDIFFVNADGSDAEKRTFIESRGIRYIVSSRTPHPGLPSRSTTDIRRSLGE